MHANFPLRLFTSLLSNHLLKCTNSDPMATPGQVPTRHCKPQTSNEIQVIAVIRNILFTGGTRV